MAPCTIGQGVALGSWPIVQGAIEAGLLVSPFEERVRTDVGYDLMVPKEALARPEVADFVDWLLDEAAVDRDTRPGGPNR